MKDLKIFIIAGEESGDLLGSEIIKNIKQQYNGKIILKGVAGNKLMAQGVTSIFPQEDISVMGFIEVIPVISRILKRINYTTEQLKLFNPNIVITIDSPDFNFRVIKKLKQSGYNTAKLVHIVAPTVWAYRPKRAKKGQTQSAFHNCRRNNNIKNN